MHLCSPVASRVERSTALVQKPLRTKALAEQNIDSSVGIYTNRIFLDDSLVFVVFGSGRINMDSNNVTCGIIFDILIF